MIMVFDEKCPVFGHQVHVERVARKKVGVVMTRALTIWLDDRKIKWSDGTNHAEISFNTLQTLQAFSTKFGR